MYSLKKYLSYLLLFILGFVFSFLVYVTFSSSFDEIVNYGFSYNISQKMIIYRDFNVLTTPLYFFLASIFIKIFGSYIISIHTLDAIICGFILLLLFRIIRWKSFVIFPILITFFPFGYNLLSLFFLILIIYLVNKKLDNDFVIGIIVGLSFITKQNIGVCLFIPYIFYSQNRFKSFLYFFLPFMFLSSYLIYNNAFYEFIDYCFLGLFDFGGKNSTFTIFTIFEFFILIYLIYKLVKSKFKDKEVFYILMFQIIVYPIFNAFHFIVGFIPVLYYFLKFLNNKYFNTVLIFIAWLFYGVVVYSIYSFFEINLDNDMFYLKNYSSEDKKIISDLYDYVNNYDYYFFTSEYSYIIKLYYGLKINNFDFVISGNLGYNGVSGKIKEIDSLCEYKSCVFFINEGNLNNQFEEFSNYIKDNYSRIDILHDFDIYINSK